MTGHLSETQVYSSDRRQENSTRRKYPETHPACKWHRHTQYFSATLSQNIRLPLSP